MSEEELNSIQELIERKILLAEVSGGLTTSDKKFINLWNYTIDLEQESKELHNKIDELKIRISSKIQKYQQKIDNEIDMGSQGDYLKICNYEEKICLLEDVLKDVVKLKDSDENES